ncbi:hypothetical protein FRX31_002627 [Thalictrum thalictroides]|uniref:Uncharacterized protein n=1 Tax=Thalictrum thalictroides TaxID=46969 RepID=A0A7J6XFT5_THATH|nr:hypothetical protein FRX31_002627 [Thalictrum thalictroides]
MSIDEEDMGDEFIDDAGIVGKDSEDGFTIDGDGVAFFVDCFVTNLNLDSHYAAEVEKQRYYDFDCKRPLYFSDKNIGEEMLL